MPNYPRYTDGFTPANKPVKAEKKQPATIKPVSLKQADIARKLKETYKLIDDIRSPWCEGCGKVTLLTHSHAVAQKRCKQLHQVQLIWDLNNISNLCMPCHVFWESGDYKRIIKLRNVATMLVYVENYDPETYRKIMASK